MLRLRGRWSQPQLSHEPGQPVGAGEDHSITSHEPAASVASVASPVKVQPRVQRLPSAVRSRRPGRTITQRVAVREIAGPRVVVRFSSPLRQPGRNRPAARTGEHGHDPVVERVLSPPAIFSVGQVDRGPGATRSTSAASVGWWPRRAESVAGEQQARNSTTPRIAPRGRGSGRPAGRLKVRLPRTWSSVVPVVRAAAFRNGRAGAPCGSARRPLPAGHHGRGSPPGRRPGGREVHMADDEGREQPGQHPSSAPAPAAAGVVAAAAHPGPMLRPTSAPVAICAGSSTFRMPK